MNIRIENTCFEKNNRQRFYLNINRKIMKLNLSQANNSRLNLYMRFQQKN